MSFRIRDLSTKYVVSEIFLYLLYGRGVFKNILGVAFFTGMRAGEILALKWKDIDFENKSITIEFQRTRGYTKKPKTKSSARTIDMISQCEVFLREQRKITGLGEYVFLNTKNKL